MYGDGTSARDYTYIDDIVDGILSAAGRCDGYGVYNLGRSEPVLLKDMIDAIAAALGKPARIQICPAKPGDVERTFADLRRSREALGIQPADCAGRRLGPLRFLVPSERGRGRRKVPRNRQCDSDAPTGLRRVAAMVAALAALSAAGCHIVVPPLYKTDVEPAGEGVFTVHELNVGSGAGEPQTFPIKTAVYHRGRGPAARTRWSSASIPPWRTRTARRRTRRTTSISRSPCIRVRRSRSPSMSRRWLSSCGPAGTARRSTGSPVRWESPYLAADSRGAVRGRFAFELAQVTALPSGDGAPIRLEVEFTAVDDLGLLRRMKLGNGRAVRSLEDSHLRRTARPSEDLDTQPLPELRPSNP